MPAEIYDKSGEKNWINGIRTGLVIPFIATDWLDLRFGAFLSITDDTADDTITGLSETLTLGVTPSEDRWWFGLKSNNDILPRTAGCVFVGFTNSEDADIDEGDSKLVSSDEGIGTTNANFWRPDNSATSAYGMISDGEDLKAVLGEGTGFTPVVHFAQNAAGAGGYATALGLRVVRSSPSSLTISVEMKATLHSGDLLFSDTPTGELLISTIQQAQTSIARLGPVTLSAIPTAFVFYWPFFNSRLRIHSVGFSKIR